jgi:hypothetical protein
MVIVGLNVLPAAMLAGTVIVPQEALLVGGAVHVNALSTYGF